MNNSEQRQGLATTDVFAISVCWIGVIGTAWACKNEPIVPIIAISAAYYLSKWIIIRD